MINKILVGVIGVSAFVVGCSSGSTDNTAAGTPGTDHALTGGTSGANSGTPPPASAGVDTTTGGATAAATNVGWFKVEPIFRKNCILCHGGRKGKGGIDLTNFPSVMKGGQDGPIVAAGDPDNSVLIKAVLGKPGVRKMPPKGDLSQSDKDLLVSWVKAGAKQG